MATPIPINNYTKITFRMLRRTIPRINIKYGIDDLLLVIKLFFRKRLPPDTNKFYVNHARTGLRIALTALNLPKNAKVGVMAYNCYSVMSAVKAAGFKIEFIDITTSFGMDMEDLISKKANLSAIIVTHLFGVVNDIELIKSICVDVPIIEDCAHAYLSESDKGQVAGSMGDIAVYSIGQGKFPAIGNGGYMQVNNKCLLDGVEAEIAKLSAYSIVSELKNIAQGSMMGIMHHPFIYGSVTRPFIKKPSNKSNDSWKHVNREAQILNSNLLMFQSQKEKYVDFLKKQRDVANKYSQVFLKSSMSKDIIWNLSLRSNCFMFPILIEDGSKLISAFLEKGVEVGSHFSRSIEWASYFGYIEGNCPVAEKVAKANVIIPCHYNLSANEINLIVSIILSL